MRAEPGSPPSRARRMSREVAGLVGARATWALLGMISGVILARQLGPYDRGVLALVLLVPSTVVTLVKLGIAQATVYVINRKQTPAAEVASNVVALALVLSAVSVTVVWLLRDTLLATVLRAVPTWALAAALIRVPLLLLDNYLYGVLQATGWFRLYNTRLIFSEALRLVLVVITVAILDLGLPAAVWLYTFVNAVTQISLITAMRREIRFSIGFDRAIMAEQLAFGLKSYVQTVTAHLLLRIDIYMVAYFLDPVQTAFYALALHFTEMVLEFPQAIGLVLYPRLASVSEEEVHRLTAQTSRRTLLVTVPCAVLFALAGPYIVILWYGQPYAPAGAPLPWAAVGVVAMSLFVILTRDFTSRGRQQVNIAAGLLALILNVGLNLVLIPAWGIVGAAFDTAVAYSAACAVLLVGYALESRASPVTVLVPTMEDVRYFWEVAQRAVTRGWRRKRWAPPATQPAASVTQGATPSDSPLPSSGDPSSPPLSQGKTREEGV